MKKALTIILILVLAVAVGGGVWQIYVRKQSQKYNLITLDTSSLPAPVTQPSTDAFVQLSEVNMHYQVYGSGKKPLILIHGNGGSVASLDEAASYLANDYTVYLTESRCHGQSSDPGEISYSLMAKDIAEFIHTMGLEKPYIMGHSDGGMIAIALAAEYPDLPGAIISCGSNSHPSKFKPYFTIGVKISNLFHKDKLNDMMLTLPDFNEEYLGRITCPAYIVAGEYDIMWLSDTAYIHSAIKGSDVAIIKSASHSTYMSHDGGKAYVLAKNWLEKLDKTKKQKLVVLDTDVGTDDAAALLAAKFLPHVHIDYIVASKGNASLEGATRNAIILKNYLGLDAKVVQGQLPKADANVNEEEKNTFHGSDGLADISADMIREMGLSEADLHDFITYDAYCEEILKCDEIEYIAVGPSTNLANSLDNEEFRSKVSKIYIMGGGIHEFNCSHNTEFNFSKDPQSVKKIMESGLDITLFTLDLTNHQRVTEEQIAALESIGTFGNYITFLRYNLQANRSYNKIEAAVLHDVMPLLYMEHPEKFTAEDMKIEVDEFGATKQSENGQPVKVVMGAEETLLNATLTDIFTNYDAVR